LETIEVPKVGVTVTVNFRVAPSASVTVKLARTSLASVLRESGNTDDPDAIYDEHWPLRVTFDFFFSMTAMAIHRIAVDVERISSQVEAS
jgi:hypothetical protein